MNDFDKQVLVLVFFFYRKKKRVSMPKKSFDDNFALKIQFKTKIQFDSSGMLMTLH